MIKISEKAKLNQEQEGVHQNLSFIELNTIIGNR